MLDSTLTPSDSNNQLNLCPSAVKNDTLAFPIELDSVRSLSHLVLAIIGLPLNLFVGVVIISFRRLRRKPRNILWLGVTIANILTLLTILFELYASYWKNEIACKLFVAMTGIAYTWLLFNLLLALSDRYIAIAHPLAHRKVNIKGVVVIQTVSFILIAFFIKFHFITGLIPLTCASKIPEHSKLIAISNILLVTLCLIAHVIVYLKSKPYFNKKEGRQLTVAFTNQRNVPLSTSSAVVISSGGASIDHKNPTVLASRDSLKVHGGSRKMEVDATYGLLVLRSIKMYCKHYLAMIIEIFLDYCFRLACFHCSYSLSLLSFLALLSGVVGLRITVANALVSLK